MRFTPLSTFRQTLFCLPLLTVFTAAPLVSLAGQSTSAPPVYRLNGKPVASCESCAEWRVPHAPMRLHGNTWYVGTRDLTAVLITGAAGHILIDPGMEETVPQLLANIRQAGFNPRDIKLILTSHVHFDHAGGAAALAATTGATVAALPWSARVLERGPMAADDPQAGLSFDLTPVPQVRVVQSGEQLTVGPLTVRALATPGHTPGSTTWSWRSCDGRDCVEVVYADSQTAISADGFRFTDQPGLAAAVEAGHRALEALPCRLLITPHPGASRLWERVAQGSAAGADSLLDVTACARYAQRARAAFAARYAREKR
jgi:metallo-beta-lactamase class B